MKAVTMCVLICALSGRGLGQPWKNPLMIARSADGVNFSTPGIFQDSSGVPSLIRWHGDTLVAAFQWFRLPNPSPGWDRVAVKFSYDGGQTWSVPTPIIVNNFPSAFQRPFDPTLVRLDSDSLRIFFSSSNGMPGPGGDSVINSYSAKSGDGIHFEMEPGPRVDIDTNRVIDPAVIRFNGLWHYAAPAGSPQAGAYHYVSSDGFHFNAAPKISSDPLHNWTGNFMIESGTELRFYGSGTTIWYNSSPNGGLWNGYVSTNILGGDPAVLKLAANSYLMIYTGPPYSTGIAHLPAPVLRVRPNPAGDGLQVELAEAGLRYIVTDVGGRTLLNGTCSGKAATLDVSALAPGLYLLRIAGTGAVCRFEKN